MKDWKEITRRDFFKWASAAYGSTMLWACGAFPRKAAMLPAGAGVLPGVPEHAPQRLIFVAIDSLDPRYMGLDAKGHPGGGEGNWLMPNIRRFLKESVWYPNARCYLPSATDMNHLNALAGTSSAQTGILGVWSQPVGWDAKGRPVVSPIKATMARDGKGQAVDTLFHAWKRQWPKSRTTMISGKQWVAGMFEYPGSPVDIIVTGKGHPSYIEPPDRESFADPRTDADAACDPESGKLPFIDPKSRSFKLKRALSRLSQGQGGALTRVMEGHSDAFPHDAWIVDATLQVFDREQPDMAYILMAQADDAGHCIGAAWDSGEFVNAQPPWVPPEGCPDLPEHQLVSSRNPLIFREAALDSIRDVDIQFGRLMDGLKSRGIAENATIILLSDHSMENHVYQADTELTDFVAMLKDAGLTKKDDLCAFTVCSYGLLYWRDQRERAAKAKKVLEDYRVFNPALGKEECPWWVLDREDMKNGAPGVCDPGELFHEHFTNSASSIMWPDLIILAKNGWQLPVYKGLVANVAFSVPSWMPPFRPYNGGHGSVATMPIMAAISTGDGVGKVLDRNIRIADLGVTAAALMGLKMQSGTVGKDLTRDLKPPRQALA